MKKSLLLSLISASLLAALSLSSCKADVDYEIIKKNPDFSDTYTNKDAYNIYYYKQPVTGETDITAWERDTQSDTTNTYVPAGSSASSLNNKGYQGFVFAGFVQNDTTINVYYKRCTIRYEFYNLLTDTNPLFVITGLFGMTCLKPVCNDRDEAYFDSWHTKNMSLYTSNFAINADSNTVNDVSTTKWYASWKDKATVLGVSLNLINPGDVLLRDGSVFPYSKVNTMNPKQKAAAVAVLVSNSYNLKTGGNVDGSTRLMAGLKTIETAWVIGDSDVLLNQFIKTTEYDGKTNRETLLNLDKDFRHNKNRTGCAILYSYDYDNIAGIAGIYKNDWYLPSEIELKLLKTEAVKNAYKYILNMDENTECWSSTSTGKGQKVKTVTIRGDSSERDKSENLVVIAFRQLD